MFADATALRATASELTALVDRSDSMAVVSPYMHSQATIFDACLTYGVPVLSTAATGIYASTLPPSRKSP